jgi:YD repeat-containing protein
MKRQPTLKPAPAARTLPLRRAPHAAALALVASLFGVTAGVVTPTLVEAATITTGTTPKDTVIRPDGAVAFVLNTGNSTLSVITVSSGTVISTISLGQPANTCGDIDWHPGLSRILVGCTNGNILDVDPVTGTVLVNATNGACNFDVICADTLTPGVTGWAIDRNTGRLYRIAGGALFPTILLGMTNPVELVEKAVDPSAPLGIDVNLYAVGATAAGQPRVTAYNRATALGAGSVLLAGVSGTPTGIASAKNAYAYVTLNVGGTGRLYQLTLGTLAWVTPAIATYGTASYDVAVAGQFVTALVQDPTLGGTFHVYDAGDPTNVLTAGTLAVSTTINPSGGLSSHMGAGGTIDDIYSIYANLTGSATAEELGAVKGSFVDAAPPSVASGVEADFQAGPAGIFPQEAFGCVPCQERLAQDAAGSVASPSPAPASASSNSVQYASGEEIFRLPIVEIPGVGLPVTFQLTYRSRKDYAYRYGQGWFLSEDVRLFTQPSGDKRAYDGTGRRDTYTYSSGSYLTPFQHDTTMTVGSSTTTISDRFGNVTTYDSTGKRVSRADRYGNTLTYTYTGDQLTGLTDTLGRSYSMSYDSTGRLSAIADFGSRTWTLKYDYLGQLRSVTTPATTQFPSGRTRYFSYSGNHATPALRSNLVHAWNHRGQKTQSLTYDADDLASGETIGNGSYTFSYDLTANKRTVVDRGGDTTVWSFDANAMVTKHERFTKGLRSGEPTSFVTNYSIGSNGYPAYMVVPSGSRIDYTYDSSMNLTGVRRRATNTSTNSTNDLVTSLTYGAYNQLATSTDALGRTTTITLDSMGNATAIARPTVTVPSTQTSTSSMTYDSLGRILTATDAESRAVAITYYTSGPRTGYVQKITRDPSGLALATELDFDAYGNITKITDPRGKSTELTVDDENYVVEVETTAPFSYRTKFTYDLDRHVVMTEIETSPRMAPQIRPRPGSRRPGPSTRSDASRARRGC